MEIETHEADVDGVRTRYLAAGSGAPMLLVHGDGDSAVSWRAVLPALARTHRVYAPDLPGPAPTTAPADAHTPAFFAAFAERFLDAVGVERAALVGNSLGGLAALRLALAAPERASALVLVDAAGLGRDVAQVQRLVTLPGYGEALIAWAATPVGRAQRAAGRAALLFARPHRAPPDWVREQYRLSGVPRFLEATLGAMRALIDLGGQRAQEVLLDRLPELALPTLVVWGAQDASLPVAHARAAASRLQRSHLAVIDDCGHLPQLERPREFVAAVDAFFSGPAREPGPRRAPRAVA